MATNNVTVNYLSRDFQSLRESLISFAKTYHSDKFSFFNDASPDMLYLEMCAYTGDMLSFYIDKTFNESFLSTALARESLVRISSDLGFNEIGTTPAQTQVVLTIKVPFKVDTSGTVVPNSDYLLAIQSGMRLGADSGTPFEVLEEVNFADPQNRTIIPNLDGNNQIIDYTIEKTAVAKAGTTKIQRFYVSDTLAKPFLNVTLDDQTITEIIGVVSTPNSVFTAPVDADFVDPDKAYFQVDYLTQDTKFVEINPVQTSSSSSTSFIEPTVKVGETIPISKRFIVRRDVNDLVTLTFGSSSPSFGAFNSLIQTQVDASTISFNQILNNTALGEIPPANSTLFIKYRTGGGSSTNTIAGQINTIVAKSFFAAGSSVDLTILQQTRNSLAVRNDLPAMGGKDLPSNEEIRATSGKIFAAQDRGVTYEDIKNLIERMPPAFGKPFRISYEEIKPRVTDYSQVENGVNIKLAELLTQTTQIGRQVKAQEITKFLNDLHTGIATIDSSTQVVSTLDAASLQLLGQIPTLWIGEKARLYIIGIDENGQLVTAIKDENGIFTSPNDLLKANIKEFLREKRVIGDWVDIVDGRVVNMQVEFTVMVDKRNKQQTLVEALTKMRDYFSINNWQMNQPIFISNAFTILQEINGVINVVDLKFYNIFGVDPITGKQYAPLETGRYRNNKLPAVNTANNKFEMNSINNVILGYPDSIFEVKYPETDIIGNAI